MNDAAACLTTLVQYTGPTLGWQGQAAALCRLLQPAAWEAAQRGAIIAALQEQLSGGDKSLVGNGGFRKFLKVVGDDHFALDAAKVAEEVRLDGFSVLRTNSKLPTPRSGHALPGTGKVEQIFRTTKAVLETRPIYHSSDAAIRGHVFCSFLALNLRKELDDRLQAAGLQLEWQDVIGDLDRLVQITVDSDGRRFVLRNQTPGCAGAVPRLSASPCRLCSVASMARSPTTRRPPNLASAASPPAAVVPREKTKRDSANPINKLHKHGVKVVLSSLSNVYIV